jgi:hypothetical protein
VTKIKVVEECGRYRLHTMAGNVIGPRLYGSRPTTGFPPLDDLFETLEAANEACRLWNEYALWHQAQRKKK